MSRMIGSLALGAVIALSFTGVSMAAGLQFQSGIAARSIIIAGGKGGEASLNPQPLPPKERAIVVVGGGEACLNPQPLPKEKAIIIVGGTGATTCLNPQPLPPKELFAR